MWFQFQNTSLQDAKLIIPPVFGDERWFFMESYHKQIFSEHGITNDRVQDNHSKSKKWVLRWLHIQYQNTQAKLVRVTHWKVYDVIVDLRKDSSSFGQRTWFELTSTNKHMLYIPRGFAHAFLTLEDGTEFLYKCDDQYNPNAECGILRDDAKLGINRSDYFSSYWINDPILSPKDLQNLSFEEFISSYTF